MRHKLTFAFAIVLTIALHGYAQTRPVASQPTHTLKIDFNQRVPMRDGVELSADVYRPDAAGQFPVILSRTPYNKNGGSTLSIARYFVPRGYVFVAMDVRGRGDSDGELCRIAMTAISWYHFTAGRVSQNMDAVDWSKIQRHLPMKTMDEAAGRPESSLERDV